MTSHCMLGVLTPCAAELFVFFIYLKLELLTRIPAANDEKYIYL